MNLQPELHVCMQSMYSCDSESLTKDYLVHATNELKITIIQYTSTPIQRFRQIEEKGPFNTNMNPRKDCNDTCQV